MSIRQLCLKRLPHHQTHLIRSIVWQVEFLQRCLSPVRPAQRKLAAGAQELRNASTQREPTLLVHEPKDLTGGEQRHQRRVTPVETLRVPRESNSARAARFRWKMREMLAGDLMRLALPRWPSTRRVRTGAVSELAGSWGRVARRAARSVAAGGLSCTTSTTTRWGAKRTTTWLRSVCAATQACTG